MAIAEYALWSALGGASAGVCPLEWLGAAEALCDTVLVEDHGADAEGKVSVSGHLDAYLKPGEGFGFLGRWVCTSRHRSCCILSLILRGLGKAIEVDQRRTNRRELCCERFGVGEGRLGDDLLNVLIGQEPHQWGA